MPVIDEKMGVIDQKMQVTDQNMRVIDQKKCKSSPKWMPSTKNVYDKKDFDRFTCIHIHNWPLQPFSRDY